MTITILPLGYRFRKEVVRNRPDPHRIRIHHADLTKKSYSERFYAAYYASGTTKAILLPLLSSRFSLPLTGFVLDTCRTTSINLLPSRTSLNYLVTTSVSSSVARYSIKSHSLSTALSPKETNLLNPLFTGIADAKQPMQTPRIDLRTQSPPARE